jgi:hypothetical protein
MRVTMNDTGPRARRLALELIVSGAPPARFADPQAGAPEDRDQPAGPLRIRAWSGAAHDEADALDGPRIGGIALCFDPWRVSRPVARVRGRGSPAAFVRYGQVKPAATISPGIRTA